MCNSRQRFSWMLTALILILTLTAPGNADQATDMKGWELGSPYNLLYNPSELDKFRGTLVGIIEITPLPGMAKGIALKVKESDDEIILVHLCPKSFIDRKSTGLKIGQRYKYRGAWSEIDDKDIFMASKIKNDDGFVLKVRLTSDGKPFWTMTDEELARERAGD